ncbi:hypothetical protein N657DRAFT_678784 [Parathielavia appendiculata]|uniref:Uncharacterized protein n=1 Tax=Parathielavia appendiculata TaxID=2587402 RepID=A0AAN6Z5E5_9PEZI|nr:hypothetical protein N657DRAFT_678784 [Parathielavia appendiculata]
MIYDVTTMVMFGGQELEAMLRPWLGKEVRDAKLADLLRSRHKSFIIGQLVQEASGESMSHRSARRSGKMKYKFTDRRMYSSSK